MAEKKTQQIMRGSIANPETAQAYLDLLDAFNALLAKMDADTGITDTDYESTLKVEE